jgi:hypothetical protein
MSDRALRFVNQLIEKTEQGKLSWSIGFEDGQFKTLLPGGRLAFVVQAKGDVRKFRMLDEKQDTVLEEIITKDDTVNEPAHHPNLILYSSIEKLQGMARSRALQVNEKLATAEKLLAAI